MLALNKFWRMIATLFGFTLFGVGGLFISLFIFPPYNFLVRSQARQKKFARNVIRYSFTLFIMTIRFLGVIDYRFIDFQKLTNQKNTIIVANHPSLLDFVLLASQIEHCSCIVKGALLHNFFLKRIVKAASYIPNNSSSDELIKRCQQQLLPEDALLIFPEGTRTTYPNPLSLQRGAANIALRTGRDLQLIHITLTAPLLTKELKWYKVPPIKPTFTIKVGDKINLQPPNHEKSINIQARELTEHLRKALQYPLS